MGKLSNYNLFVHRAYLEVLPQEEFLKALATLKKELIEIPDFTIVKYGIKTGNFSFIRCPDFNTSPEPIMAGSWLIKFNQRLTYQKQLDDPYIYHHKWLMVKDDFHGFDVEESKARSQTWMDMKGFSKTKIGRWSYWTSTVEPRIELDL